MEDERWLEHIAVKSKLPAQHNHCKLSSAWDTLFSLPPPILTRFCLCKTSGWSSLRPAWRPATTKYQQNMKIVLVLVLIRGWFKWLGGTKKMMLPDQINIQKKTTTRKTTHSKHQRYREAGARVSTTQGCGDAACQGCVEALGLQ